MGVAAIARQLEEGLGHEGGAQAVLLGDRAHHVLEEGMAVGGLERRIVLPVHLELAVRILVVVLVGLPAQRLHGVTDFRDHVVAAHQRLLVVARLALAVGGIGDLRAVRRWLPDRSAWRPPCPGRSKKGAEAAQPVIAASLSGSKKCSRPGWTDSR